MRSPVVVVVALVLGLMSRTKGKRVGVKQGRAGAVLGAIALALGVAGLVIVTNAFDEFGDDVDCLDEADTPAEIDACN